MGWFNWLLGYEDVDRRPPGSRLAPGFRHYKLVNGQVEPCGFVEGARLFEQSDRRVGFTDVPEAHAAVSTVFLCLDHSDGQGRPVVFESLIQGGAYDGLIYRYCTLSEAQRGHVQIVDALRAGELPVPEFGMQSVFNFFAGMAHRDHTTDEGS